MEKVYFVAEDSIVRKIWGKSETILFIFAGASAEFALNKAVDWLYFTGKLPADPIGRLFSTVGYAQKIVFAEKHVALNAIDSMTAIHQVVETKRSQQIPDWAYRDVLFMLMDYSIRSFELLERKLTQKEKQEIIHVFLQMGHRMGLSGLPETLEAWQQMRQTHLNHHLRYSDYTLDLFLQYRKHVGPLRYAILRAVQKLITPPQVRALLGYRKKSLLYPLITVYKLSKRIKADWLLKALLLPAAYKKQIEMLDKKPVMG